MQEADRWVFTICCGTLLCGVVSVLIPGKSMEKPMRMVLGLFMLCCFLLPAGVTFDLPGLGLEEAQQEAEQAAREVTGYFFRDSLEKGEDAVRETVAKELREYGINEQDIQIYIEADGEEKTEDLGDECLPGLTARVRLPHGLGDGEEGLRKRLEEKLGITVRLEYGGE